MLLFWEVSRLSLKRQLTYRAATLAGLVTNFIFGLLRAMVNLARRSLPVMVEYALAFDISLTSGAGQWLAHALLTQAGWLSWDRPPCAWAFAAW